MQKPFLLIAAIFSCVSSYATNVSGLINSNTTWTKANSPYIVTGDIDVDTGVTLIIEPGVQVRFDGNFALLIDGKIKAKGTSTDSIYFTYNKPNPTNASWKGVGIRHKSPLDTFTFDYCHFQYGNYALTSTFSPVNITNSLFDNNMTALKSDAYIYASNSRYINNSYAITAYGTAIITDNEISCSYFGLYNGGTDIFNNNIHHCTNGIWGGKNIHHNIITFCEKGVTGAVTITYNQIWYCQTAITYSGGSFPIQHNGLKYNETGILINGYYLPGTIRYNCIEHSSKFAVSHHAWDANIADNYWGETDSVKIAAMVWDFYDNFNSGKLVFTPVLQSADSGCMDSISLPSHPTSISTTKTYNNVNVYPNPVNSAFTIDAGNQTIKDIAIYNITGTLVMHLTPEKSKQQIDATSFSQGLYMYKLQLSDNSIITGKIAKE